MKLKKLSNDGKVNLVSALVLAATLLVVMLFGSTFIVRVFCMASMYALISSAWNIIGGYAGQFSMGHAVFFGLGAYVTGIMYSQFAITPWVGIIVAGLISGGIGLLMGIPVFRLKGSYMVLSTTSFLFIIRTLMKTIKNIGPIKLGGGRGYPIKWGGSILDMQSKNLKICLLMIVFLLIITILVSAWVKYSKMGYYLFAVANNQDAAHSLGVNVKKTKLKAMFISSFMTALGGGFYAMFNQYMEADVVFAYTISITIVLFAIVGGKGTLWGPVFGAYIMYPVSEMLRSSLGANFAGVSNVIYGLIFMIIIMFLPKGVFGTIEDKYLTYRYHKEVAEMEKAAAESSAVSGAGEE